MAAAFRACTRLSDAAILQSASTAAWLTPDAKASPSVATGPALGSTDDRIKDMGLGPQSFDIARATRANTSYRSVAWGGRYLRVTLMSIPVGGDIGLEPHPQIDEFLRLEVGTGRVQMGAAKDELSFEGIVFGGWCATALAGTWHNITNTGSAPMQVYPFYAPAHYAPDMVQAAAASASADKDAAPAVCSVQPEHEPDRHG